MQAGFQEPRTRDKGVCKWGAAAPPPNYNFNSSNNNSSNINTTTNNNNINNNNNNKVARASAPRGVCRLLLGGFFGRSQANPVICEVFVNNTMCRRFRFPMFFVLVFW